MALIQSIRFRPNSPLDYDAFPLVVFGITAMLFLNLAFAEVWCVAILAYSYVLLGSSVAKARGLSYQKKNKKWIQISFYYWKKSLIYSNSMSFS